LKQKILGANFLFVVTVILVNFYIGLIQRIRHVFMIMEGILLLLFWI